MLTAEEHWQYAMGLMSPGHRELTLTLHDLPVAPGDAERLMSARAGWTSWISFTALHEYGASVTPVSYLSRIQVTPQEADRMLNGEHPMAVLLPRIWARPLTLEEMMGA
jgi:hypothetical protein